MKPPPLAYVRPETLAEAVAALREHADEGRVLAGGQSLVPMLNLRLARPAVLVDVTRVPELLALRRENGSLVLGAAVRQRDAERDPDVVAACPLLVSAIRHIGHTQIRARGTVGGSIAHADPAAELAAVCLVLEAELVAEGGSGRRSIAAADFFLGPWTTALREDDVLVEVRLPVRDDLGTAFVELARRPGDFALCGVAAAVRRDARGALDDVRLAAIGVAGTPSRLPAAEGTLLGAPLSAEALAAAGAAAAGEIEALDDHRGSARYRRELLAALVTRALREAIA